MIRGMSQTPAVAHDSGALIAPCLAPGRDYKFSFPLTNPVSAQESPTVSMQASSSAADIEVTEAVKDATSVLPYPNAVAGDAEPLKTYNVDFLIKDIGQSTSGPCPNYTLALWCFQDNIITVTLS